ncbi:hypothetical protein IJT17_07285 [bacterium]|nr:hypothetical protein [bacterium]
MSENQAFLDLVENTRLGIEERLLHLPEASRLLGLYPQAGRVTAQQCLHAAPTICALLKIWAFSPRTTGTVASKYAEYGREPALSQDVVGRALMCFGFARLYRVIAKQYATPEFAQLFLRILCLSALDDRALEQVDWVSQAVYTSRHSSSSRDWLAPALLFTVWTIRTESPQKARQIAGLLDALDDYTVKAWEYALSNQLYLQYPW